MPAKEGSYDEVHAFVVCAEDKREQTEEKLKEIKLIRRSGNETKRHTFCGFYTKNNYQPKPKRYLLKKMVMEDNLDSLGQSRRKIVSTRCKSRFKF